MAGDWLKVEATTPDKPEVIGIADLLGIPPTHAFGALFMVWRWFDQHTTKGNAPFVTKVTVDRLSGVTGFADAMQKVGWLSVDGDGSISLPHFDRHNGETAKQRGLTAKRVAKSKAKSNAGSNATSNYSGNAQVTVDALPREEKRREEVNPQTPRKRGASDRGVQFKTFLADCKAKGEAPISSYKPVFDWAATVGLQLEFVQLAWFEFGRQFGEGGVKEANKQKDWRKTFRNYVEKNYLKLWYSTAEGKHELTTLGHQAQKANAERLAA